MQFLTNWLKNLGFLLIIGFVLFIAFPDMMKQVIELFGMVFGPLILVILLVAALPKRRRGNR